MRGLSRSTAAVGGLVLLLASSDARAQRAVSVAEPIGRVASLSAGSIQGVVHDERGLPVNGALISAVGATTVFAVTDRSGRFELPTLSPGPYLVRAHLTGFVASQGQIVEVRASSRASSAIALRHAATAAGSARPVVAAGVGVPALPAEPPAAQPSGPGEEVATAGTSASGNDDHGEMAWRLRHAKRSILQDVTVPDTLIADQSPVPDANIFGPANTFGRAVGSPARVATSFFGGTPFSGQLNLLTTSSFDTPQRLFASDNLARGVAYFSVGAPVGGSADWAVRGAITQADISSWVVAGVYSTRGPATHHYDIGLSYATQRYDGGNPAALRDVTDGSRNAGALYAFDTFTISPEVAITYGGRYARYDYLDGKSLISPRVGLTLSPSDHFRISTLVARRASAPGAEEFLPPGDTGVWLPPQRTFSSLSNGRRLEPERTTHLELEVESDLGGGSTMSVRAFRQYVADQLVTMFGEQIPGLPSATLGHYFVSNAGKVDASGFGAGLRTAIAGRVHGSIEYSVTQARWNPGDDLGYMILMAPSALTLRSGRIHDVSTAIETNVPETSTRVVVLYRVSNAFARPGAADDHALLDSRFDVQVRQPLPFMDFSTAKWEMLLGVRNFFRETAADQSVYDELLVVHPPKRIVGGLTLRF